MSDGLTIVQFPHPGGEHNPSAAVMGWNRGDHARKFLRATATYLDGEQPKHAAVVFWGEWEPQSRVLAHWPKSGRLPTFLHKSFWVVRDDGRPRQNTDPFVFGDRFVYTNCKQPSNQKLRRLPPGSLILFGSGQKHGFVLDTVFVVGEQEPYPYKIGEHPDIDRPELGPLVFDSLALNPDDLGKQCVVYEGATIEQPVNGMYGYIPCMPADLDDPRFERPLIDCPPYVHPKLRMGAKVTPVTSDAAAQRGSSSANWSPTRALRWQCTSTCPSRRRNLPGEADDQYARGCGAASSATRSGRCAKASLRRRRALPAR